MAPNVLRAYDTQAITLSSSEGPISKDFLYLLAWQLGCSRLGSPDLRQASITRYVYMPIYANIFVYIYVHIYIYV